MSELDAYVDRLIAGGGETAVVGGWKGQAFVTFPSGMGQFEVFVLAGRPKRGRTFVQVGVDAGSATVGTLKTRAGNADLDQAAGYSRQQGVPPVAISLGVASALVRAARPPEIAPGSDLEKALAFFDRLPCEALPPLVLPDGPTAAALPSGGGFDYWFFDAFDLDAAGVALPVEPPDDAWGAAHGPTLAADEALRTRTALCLALGARVAGWAGDAALAQTLLGLLAEHRRAEGASATTAALWRRTVDYARRRFDADQSRSPGDPARIDAMSAAHVGQRGAPTTADLMAVHLAEAAVSVVGDGAATRKAALRLGHAIALELRHEAPEGSVQEAMPDAREDLAGGHFGDVLPAMLEAMGRFAVEVCTGCTAHCLEQVVDAPGLLRNGVHPFRIGKPWAPAPAKPAAAAPKGRAAKRRPKRRR